MVSPFEVKLIKLKCIGVIVFLPLLS